MASLGFKNKKNQSDTELCAGYLKALGDPNRLQLMKALRSSPLTVTDLSIMLEAELANVSHHLRVLYRTGLVITERDGKYIYYQLNRDIVGHKSVANALDLGCCRLEMRS